MSTPNGELDPVIHAQARLRVMTTLAALPAGDRLSFARLQELLDMTPGNLITHLRKLDEAGYTRSTKTGTGRTTTTYVCLTSDGRAAFDRYVRQLRTLLEPAAGGES
ncbi:winged helix DNA-binding protein [Halopolyspora algeriensis]|uniref:Winged helix DNA-binding protein n=1 Tax=Halopolyspora algeriensis TaxID=1500506 RepID=A0A368VFD2_9ACTN|nr:transcriptional regulator [Halopolyspora algeriensis]RCW39923.1 winged helix DNA-binding protein [Halopolyspora algeriensis]TQM46640.1 winged helix DNA-binding protein [Halopolyspora algeriensis]